LLELISIHALNVAPNITAWAATLESYWSRRGFTIQERRAFRTRLGNAVHWYQVLLNQRDGVVTAAVDESPSTRAASSDDEDVDWTERETTASTQAPESKASEHHSRPSDFLRQRCPLCFGGQRPDLKHTDAHVIVCIDGNFSQKRRKSEDLDPAFAFRKTVRKRTKGTSARLDDDVLDECNNSFTAAQEKVTKASKNYYSDTGLMALLCRHDRVLFVVNLTSPGERQHYALVLLKMLFDALPHDWMVGVLYDIACQLSCSIEKVRWSTSF
ncbi:hypothetical protein EXIGLDRAFT_606855, partial [Exidia glandulosa HHB12029]